MPQALLTSPEEYLATSNEDGDREFVDGELMEVNVGEIDHGTIQMAISSWFFTRRRQLDLFPITEVRTRVSATRVRLPDVAIVKGDRPTGRILTEPPFLVVEILSPEDRVSRMETRIDDYLQFGVEWIWLIDPKTGNGHIYTAQNRIPVTDGIYRTTSPAVEMDFGQLFD